MGLKLESVALLCALHLAPALATVPDTWKDLTYSQIGTTSSVGQALSEFAKAIGLKLQAPPALAQIKYERAGGATTPGGFLDRLAARHSLTWFVYGGVLYVEQAPQIAMRRMELRGSSAAAAKQALIGIGLFEPKYGWGELDDDSPAVLISGAAAYVDLVREAIERLPAKDTNEHQFMVFQLKHASVSDYETAVRDKITVRPGVASMLRSLLAGESTGRDMTRSARSTLEAFKGPLQPVGAPAATTETPPLALASGSPVRRASAPSVEAFPATNSLVVRDAPQRRAMYEQLVAALDQPTVQIEILATVVDAQAGTLHEWSMDLRLGTRNGVRTGLPASGEGALNQPTVVLWASDILDVRLRALEANGKAKIVSRPSILTINNQGATLDLSRTAYIKLEGERVADVRAVTVGSLLSVTPRVVSDDKGASVLLSVNIEDGTFDSNLAMPQASRNMISTQALVGVDQALVIGGYQQETTELRKSEVPGLGSLPVVGRMFQRDFKQGATRERLYVISARILSQAPRH
ncbi:type III secretion protein C [Variovorax boronicumulans]|uniref:secretin N-terminal domain-containing protein n=1 Tax=Variovorax boronicumulans TaxID=436515 RepID=UPI0027818D2E|nr:secretin N-terminal domain-containing protein [Variovorax boronicumulans]MDQ0083825.1 type III secretion protein C [Variovorax boronicumulans]